MPEDSGSRYKSTALKGRFAKNERGYRLTSICSVYKQKILKNNSFRKLKHATGIVKKNNLSPN